MPRLPHKIGCVISCARVAGIALGRWLWLSLVRSLLLILYPVQSHSQVLGRVADVVELLNDQLDLLAQFTCAWIRPEFDGLDEGALELLIELVSCLDLEHIVAKGDDVGDGLHL